MAASQGHDIQTIHETACCIVGGGPAGAMLALLLARQSLHVTLLESHLNFDRDFRGDTLHPSVLEILDSIGLADRLLELKHSKIDRLSIQTPDESVQLIDLRRLKTKYPYITLISPSYHPHSASRLLGFHHNRDQAFSTFPTPHGSQRPGIG